MDDFATVRFGSHAKSFPLSPGPVVFGSDFHGDFGPVNKYLSRYHPSVLLVCGDFGFWPSLDGTDKVGRERIGSVRRHKWRQDGLKSGRTLVLAAPGNHEQWDALEDMWERGETMVSPFVHILPPGAIADIFGVKTVFVGGARSNERDRIPEEEGSEWFRSEVVSDRDVVGIGRVDVVVSHTAPKVFLSQERRSHWSKSPATVKNGMSLLGKYPERSDDPSYGPLGRLLEEAAPALWAFGHFHEHVSGTWSGCDYMCVNMPGKTSGFIKMMKKEWEDIPHKGGFRCRRS